MRVWTLHPKYLDARGLVALWREALLAKIESELPPLPEIKHLLRFIRTSERSISK